MPHVCQRSVHVCQGTEIWHVCGLLLHFCNSVVSLSDSLIHCLLGSSHLGFHFLDSFNVSVILLLLDGFGGDGWLGGKLGLLICNLLLDSCLSSDQHLLELSSLGPGLSDSLNVLPILINSRVLSGFFFLESLLLFGILLLLCFLLGSTHLAPGFILRKKLISSGGHCCSLVHISRSCNLNTSLTPWLLSWYFNLSCSSLLFFDVHLSLSLSSLLLSNLCLSFSFCLGLSLSIHSWVNSGRDFINCNRRNCLRSSLGGRLSLFSNLSLGLWICSSLFFSSLDSLLVIWGSLSSWLGVVPHEGREIKSLESCSVASCLRQVQRISLMDVLLLLSGHPVFEVSLDRGLDTSFGVDSSGLGFYE